MQRALLAACALLAAGCASPDDGGPSPGTSATCGVPLPAPEDAWRAEKPRVRFDTTLGSFVAEIETEAAPLTASNFLNLTASGFYDGTRFHRIVRGFAIQGGDPLSKDDNAANDGTGGPGYAIPDEFHPNLRHDGIGVLSMANSGPDTGGSQFFVTLDKAAHLDDRHSVFGRVVEGLDVVRAIGNVSVNSEDRPLEPVTVTKVERIDAAPYDVAHGVDLHVVVPNKTTEPDRAARFAIVLQNRGNVREAIAIDVVPPGGWTCVTDAPRVVPAGAGRVVFLTLKPGPNATGTHSIEVRANGTSGAVASTTVTVQVATLGAAVQLGDQVSANYAGILPDGRLFDTSMPAVGLDPEQPKFETLGGWQPKPGYSPFPFTVGRNVITGFTKLAQTAKAGEIVTGYIEAEDAYAYDPRGASIYADPLTGRDLVFELEILSVG